MSDTLAIVITKGVFQDGWNKMKERTSAGISGIHFGQLNESATKSWEDLPHTMLRNINFSQRNSMVVDLINVLLIMHYTND